MAQILIVDDSRFQRMKLRRLMEQEGHQVSEAEDGVQALAKLESCQPDCMLLDLIMPEMNGFGVLEALQASDHALPVIVVSADIQRSTKEKVLGLGARDLVQKTNEDKILVDALNKALACDAKP